jgi:hypothetical protein
MMVFGLFRPASQTTTASSCRLIRESRFSFSSLGGASPAPWSVRDFQALSVVITLSSVYGEDDGTSTEVL